MQTVPVGFGQHLDVRASGNLGVLVSAYNTGKVSCEINGRTILPMPYTATFLDLVFDGGRNIIPSEPIGFDDSGAKIRHYQLLRDACCRNDQRQVDYTLDSRQYASRPRAELFEIQVSRGLYAYILAFPDASYIRTPLRRRVAIT